jgi:hypothetical protein
MSRKRGFYSPAGLLRNEERSASRIVYDSMQRIKIRTTHRNSFFYVEGHLWFLSRPVYTSCLSGCHIFLCIAHQYTRRYGIHHLYDEVISRRLLSEASSLAYAVALAFAIGPSVIERINHPVEELVNADRVEHRGPPGSVERHRKAVVGKYNAEQIPLGIDPEERSGAAGFPKGL